jgi:HSP20 family molecular chaperone IbpA
MLRGVRKKAEVFETHNHVIVKISISYEANPIVKVRTDAVKIEGMFDNKKQQLIRLPCLVVPSTARATYKEGILQIKVRKKKLNKSYREVSIRYI